MTTLLSIPPRKGWAVLTAFIGLLAFSTFFAKAIEPPGSARRAAHWPAGLAVSGGPSVDLSLHAAQVPRGLILKLREGIETCLSCRIGQGRQLGALVLGSRLDALNRRFGVRAARPLLQARARGLAPEDRAAAAQRRAAVAGRFAARARRAQPHATVPDFSRTYVLELRRHPDMEAVARTYAADPAVEYCEPDHIVRAVMVPDDPFLWSVGSWGQPFSDLWGIHSIGAPAAWNVTRGAGVVVAVIDTGIDYAHPDISANFWLNAAEIPANGIDDDLNGFVDDVRGWNFVEDNDDPLDDNFHGTHVAGIIAAVGDNTAGVAGVAYESRVMAVRGLGTWGYGRSSDLAEAIDYAVDNGADVINASWGGRFSRTIADAVAAAHAAGVVFVAAAGNDARDVVSHFPSALSRAIAVAALTHEDTRATFSNFGVQIDVGAPGGGDPPPPPESDFPSLSILSLKSSAMSRSITPAPKLVLAQGGAEYLRLAGTSMAAPHVSGVAALVLAAQPALGVEEVRQVLRSTADDIGPAGFDADGGAGRVNAARAVVAPPPLVALLSEPAGGQISGATAIEVRGSAAGPGFTSYGLDYRPAADPTGWVPIVDTAATPVLEGLLGIWDVSSVDDGNYVLRLVAERPGEKFTDHVSVVLDNVVIDSPQPLAALRNDAPIEIRGTAAGAGFVGYQVEYLRRAMDPTAWRTDGVTVAAPPGAPVRRGLLATIDASQLTEGDRFDFRLTVQNGAGTGEATRKGIVIDPTIRPGWPQPLVGTSTFEYLTITDLDGDGVQEILVGSGDEVVVFEPDGSVRPGWPRSVATSGFPFVATHGSPVVADIAGDPAPEVIATNGTQVLAWTADGELLPGFPVTVDYFYTFGAVNHLTAGDSDGDGKDDIICTGPMAMRVYRGDGSEVTDAARYYYYGGVGSTAAQVVGDARVEIGLFERPTWRSRRRYITLLAPDGTTIAERSTKLGWFPYLGMADLDGDGVLELQGVRESPHRDRMKIEAINLSGARVKVRSRKPTGIGGHGRKGSGQVSFADLDRNGFAEAYSYERRGPTNLVPDQFGRYEDEFGLFVIRQHVGAGPAPALLVHRLFQTVEPGGIAIGDIDGDGVQDLVAGVIGRACGPGECRYSRGRWLRRALVAQRLDGSLVPKFPKPLPQLVTEDEDSYITITIATADSRVNTPGIADLDGDGLKEVLFVDPLYDRLFVWDVAGTPGPVVADWPMCHHDAKHTNVLPAGQ